MKIAVVGSGSTYTPELVSGLARARAARRRQELALHDIDEERREVVGGLARRMLARQGFEGELSSRTTSTARSTAPTSSSSRSASAARQAALRRDGAARVRLHRPGDDRRGRAREGASHRSGGARDRRARARARRRRRLDRRLHEPGRHRHARAARRRSPRGRPLQRRDRLPALTRGCSGSSPSGSSSTRSGLNHLTWVRAVGSTARRAPELLAEHGDDARRTGPPASAAARGARRRPVVLPPLLLRARRGARRAARRGAARRAVAEIERELLELYRDPALTEKPALLERRGGAFYSEAAIGLVASLVDRRRRRVHVVDVRNGETLAGLAPDDVVEVPARVERRRPGRSRSPRSRPSCSASIQHVAAYERLAAQAAVTGDRRSRARPCSRIRWSASTRSPPTRRPSARGGRAPSAVPEATRVRERERSRRRRRQLEDRPRAGRADGTLLALRRGPLSSPHHLGLDGCLDVLEDLLHGALGAGRAPRDGRGRRRRRRAPAGGRRLPERGARAPAGARERRGWAAATASATTRSRSCARAPSAAGASPSSAARGSTASASRRTAARALPGARRDHGRLGRRLRRRPGRALGGRPSEDGAGRRRPSSTRCRALRPRRRASSRRRSIGARSRTAA